MEFDCDVTALVALAKELSSQTKKLQLPEGTHPVDVELLVRVKGAVTKAAGYEQVKIPAPWREVLAMVLAGVASRVGEQKLLNLFARCYNSFLAGTKLSKREVQWLDKCLAEQARTETLLCEKEKRATAKKKRFTVSCSGATKAALEGSVLEVISGRDIDLDRHAEVIEIQPRKAHGGA